ncbi:hypothetical protein FF1_014328 [Malus domestica]
MGKVSLIGNWVIVLGRSKLMRTSNIRNIPGPATDRDDVNTSLVVGREIATVEVPEEHTGPVVELLGKSWGRFDMQGVGLEGTTFLKQREYTFLFNDWPQLLQLSIGSKNLILGQAIHAFLLKCG